MVSGLERTAVGSLVTGKRAVCALSRRFMKPLLGLLLTVSICLAFTSLQAALAPTVDDGQGRAHLLATTVVSFSASPSRGYVGDTITFFANASSDVSTELTFTLYFDSLLADYSNNTESPVFTATTGNPGFMSTAHEYSYIGNLSSASGTYFRAKLYVGDGTNTVSTSLSVYIVENAPPTFSLELSGTIDVSADEMATFVTEVTDVDDDILVVTWDFGDGSDLAVNTTGPAAGGVPVMQSHVWSPYLEPGIGDYFIYYWMNLTVEDGVGHTDLTWTYEFRNDTGIYNTTVLRTPATADNTTLWSNLTHVFSQAGNYTVTFWISDVLDPDLQVFPDNTSKSIAVISAINHLPELQANISFSPQLIYLDEASGTAIAQVSIEGYDVDGDVVYATWGFGDGSDPAYNESVGTRLQFKFSQLHEYNESGIYNVSCTVTDGREGHEIVKYLSLIVRSNNSAPSLMGMPRTLSNGTFAMVNTTVTITIILSDEEKDRIRVGWMFGDNTSLLITEISEYDETGNGTSTAEHVYTSLGDYNVVIWYTDDKFDNKWHNDSRNVTISVRSAWVKVIIVWDAWDYASLSAFLGAIASVFAYAWYAGRFRRRLDSQGLSYDEYKIINREKRDAERAKRAAEAAARKNRPGKGGEGGKR